MRKPTERDLMSINAIMNREHIDLLPCEFNGVETQAIVYVKPDGIVPLAILVKPAMGNKLKILVER